MSKEVEEDYFYLRLIFEGIISYQDLEYMCYEDLIKINAIYEMHNSYTNAIKEMQRLDHEKNIERISKK